MTRNGGITKFTWDYRNRLTNTFDIASANNTYYGYDHNNQRFIKWTEDYVYVDPEIEEELLAKDLSTEAYIPDGDISSDVILEEEASLDGAGYWEWQTVALDKYVDKYFEKNLNNQTKSHIYLNDIKLATVNNSDQPYYILSDNLDSNSILTDNAGSLAQSSDYKPFGEIVYNNTITDLKNDYEHNGKEADEETTLQYYGARYYDNKLGKFISVEPVMLVLYDGDKVKSISGQELKKVLSDPQALNSYAYSRNNPIILVDVDGNWWRELITGKQSLSSFRVELGQAAQQLYNDNGTARAAMDHPYITGAVVGVAGGAAFAGASAGLTALSTQYLGGAGTACIAFCNQIDKASRALESGMGWSPGKVYDSAKNLVSHFEKHGSEVGAKNIDQYYQKANEFVKGGYTNIFKEGADRVYYNVNNNLSAILDQNGALKTFYKVENINKINNYLERIININ